MFITGVDDDIVSCRAYGHRWPSKNLRSGRKLPRGFVPRAVHNGSVEITEICPDCGKKRVTVTLPGGAFNKEVIRNYVDPPNWPVFKGDDRKTPRDFQAEMYRRVNEELMAEARRNPLPHDGDASGD